MHKLMRVALAATLAVAFLVLVQGAVGEDWPMWGRTPDRNMVTPEKGAPTDWDTASNKNIKWVAQLGSQSYGNPVVANGVVIVGTNNGGKYDPKISGDAGVILMFDEKTGKFLYQRLTPKHPAGRVNDWQFQGVCSTVCVEGDYAWYATNRCEVVCLYLSPLKAGQPPKEVWVYDMMKEQGVFPHNMTSCSTLVWQDYIYMITGNGVDETHKNLPAPDAPSVICFNKKTGEAVWTDHSPGARILHGQWASPAMATVNGRTQIICPLGDGWIYAYEAKTGKIIWKFDSNNKNTIYPSTRNELIATPVVVGNVCYIANGQDPEHGEGPGHLWCIDITGEGDVSMELSEEENAPKPKAGEELIGPAGSGAFLAKKGKPNPNSKVVWHFDHDPKVKGAAKAKDRMNRTISSVAVSNGLAFVPDFSGYLHCFDARTGQRYWAYNMDAAMWGSPMIADGKVYLCDESGDVAIIPASKELKEDAITTVSMGDVASYCSPVFANGTLYIMTKDKLFAISEKK